MPQFLAALDGRVMLYCPLGNNCVLVVLAGVVTPQTWSAPAFVPSLIETPVPNAQAAAMRFYSQWENVKANWNGS